MHKSNDTDLAAAKKDDLVLGFLVPLQGAGVDTTQINEEWEDMVDYAQQ